MIKIESGLRKLNNGSYIYSYWKDGEYYVVAFTANDNETPEIGDFIDGGVLLKREGIQVTNDGTKKWPGTEHSDNGWEDPDYAHDGWDRGDYNV